MSRLASCAICKTMQLVTLCTACQRLVCWQCNRNEAETCPALVASEEEVGRTGPRTERGEE